MMVGSYYGANCDQWYVWPLRFFNNSTGVKYEEVGRLWKYICTFKYRIPLLQISRP